MIKKINIAFISLYYVTLKWDIGFGYKITIELIKDHIKENCIYISITIDL